MNQGRKNGGGRYNDQTQRTGGGRSDQNQNRNNQFSNQSQSGRSNYQQDPQPKKNTGGQETEIVYKVRRSVNQQENEKDRSVSSKSDTQQRLSEDFSTLGQPKQTDNKKVNKDQGKIQNNKNNKQQKQQVYVVKKPQIQIQNVDGQIQIDQSLIKSQSVEIIEHEPKISLGSSPEQEIQKPVEIQVQKDQEGSPKNLKVQEPVAVFNSPSSKSGEKLNFSSSHRRQQSANNTISLDLEDLAQNSKEETKQNQSINNDNLLRKLKVLESQIKLDSLAEIIQRIFKVLQDDQITLIDQIQFYSETMEQLQLNENEQNQLENQEDLTEEESNRYNLFIFVVNALIRTHFQENSNASLKEALNLINLITKYEDNPEIISLSFQIQSILQSRLKKTPRNLMDPGNAYMFVSPKFSQFSNNRDDALSSQISTRTLISQQVRCLKPQQINDILNIAQHLQIKQNFLQRKQFQQIDNDDKYDLLSIIGFGMSNIKQTLMSSPSMPNFKKLDA